MEKPDFPYQNKKFNGKRKWVMFIGVALFIGVVLLARLIVTWGSIYATQKQNETSGSGVKKALTVENKNPSNYGTIKRKRFVTINIINRTDNTEHEEEIVRALVESGYSLSNIESGKAEVIGDNGTTITSSADYEEIVENIKDVLKSVIPEITDGVPNNDPNIDSEFDVVIIAGSRVINTIVPTGRGAIPEKIDVNVQKSK